MATLADLRDWDGAYLERSEDHIHIIPLHDMTRHEPHAHCWCHPIPDDEQPNLLHHRVAQ